jgi:hypothetical protein
MVLTLGFFVVVAVNRLIQSICDVPVWLQVGAAASAVWLRSIWGAATAQPY